jgi:hypothetical protein
MVWSATWLMGVRFDGSKGSWRFQAKAVVEVSIFIILQAFEEPQNL